MASTPADLTSATINLPSGTSLSILYHIPLHPSPTSPTVLCLPFWGGSAWTFNSVLQSLASQSPSTISIAVSYPGTGTSEPAPDDTDPEQHSVSALTRDLLAALQTQQLQDLIASRKLIVIAHSMSAKIACELMPAVSSPSTTFQVEVSSLLLLAPAPPTPLVLPEDMRQQQLTAYSNFESARWTMVNVLTHKQLPDQVLDSLATDAANQSEGAKRGWIEIGMGYDCTTALRSLGERGRYVPVRVLVGSADQVETVERVEEMTLKPCAAAGWDIDMRVVEDVGHLLPVEAVEEVVQDCMRLLEDVSIGKVT